MAILAVAHIDQIAAALNDLDEGAHNAGARLHRSQASVANGDADNLSARGDAISLRVVGKVGRRNAGHVRSVSAALADNLQQVALAVNVDAVVELVAV